MYTRSPLKSAFLACVVAVASAGPLATPALANGITIETGPGWRIESDPNRGGWSWEAGKRGGRSATRDGAIKAAKAANKEQRKLEREKRRRERKEKKK